MHKSCIIAYKKKNKSSKKVETKEEVQAIE